MRIRHIENMVTPQDTQYSRITGLTQTEYYEELLTLIELGAPTRVQYEDGSMKCYNELDGEHMSNYAAFQDEAINGYNEGGC